MTIKGTLETFNLCELLQMLAFNRKVGTLVLEADGGARTAYLAGGEVTLLAGDPHLHGSLLRLARRHRVCDAASLQLAVERCERSKRHLADVLRELGHLDGETRDAWMREAIIDQLFEAQLTSVAGFEFLEGASLLPDRSPGVAAAPAQPVDGMLLELARRLDQWNAVTEVIPSPREVFEGTGIGVDLSQDPDVDRELADALIPLIDGRRSLEDLAEAVHGTIYAVCQVAAALFMAGGLRAVPTPDLITSAEELLARGEAVASLPMLRRAIERGDAPIDVRLRLADALEASAQPAEAAAELDTYAALSSDEDASQVFDALSRALRLRAGDLGTAMRVCDFYLRRRPWLREFRSQACLALREVIQGASRARRPLDAAHRLAGFLQCGDAASEDLVLLADLYAAGGERAEAATALARRAEDLFAMERAVQAQELLRRAIQLDPSNADAKRRVQEVAGLSRRRLHKTRMVLLVLLLVAVVGGAGYTYVTYRSSATTEVAGARQAAESALDVAEGGARQLIAAFNTYVEAASVSETLDETLGERAEELRRAVRATMSGCQRALSSYGLEIDSYSASGEQEHHRGVLRGLEQRRHYMNSQATAVVQDINRRARRAMERARTLHAEGKFVELRGELLAARNLAIGDDEVRQSAIQLLNHVSSYSEQFATFERKLTGATQAGDLEAAFRIGASALTTLMDSDLTRRLPFPVRVESEPEGAQVWMGTSDTGKVTPCVITYCPFDARPYLVVRMPGRTSARMDLPTYAQIVKQPEAMAAWKPLFRPTLLAGPRWTQSDPGQGFTALWASGNVPVVVGGRGLDVYAASPEDGALLLGDRLDPSYPGIRVGGVLNGGIRWHVRGPITLSVRPGAGEPWSEQSLGRIERPPVVVGGNLIFVDEVGTLWCRDVRDGAFRWRRELGESPSQPPSVSALGILIGTVGGATYRISPATGEHERLAPAIRGAAFALPFGRGAVVLGGGSGGLRFVSEDGNVEVAGDAAPLPDRLPIVCEQGLAWVERDGVRWLSASDRRVSPVPALGLQTVWLACEGGTLLGTDAAGRLSGVRVEKPGERGWSLALGGVVEAPPVLLASTVYVLVGGRLLAVEI